MGNLDDIQTALILREKKLFDILELAKSFKMTTRADPTVTLFYGTFIFKVKKIDLYFDTTFIQANM